MHGRRKNYRAWDAQQCSQEPVAPRDALPEDDLVFFLLDLVPQIDLSPFHQYYAQELRGQPPFDVTMMVTLLVYAYSVESAPAEGSRPPASAIWPFAPLSVTIRLTSAQSAISARSTWRRFGPCSSRCCAGWRDGYGQAWKPVHRRDEDGSERLAAQGDELRLHEQGNPAAGS